MAEIKLVYSELQDASEYAAKVATKCDTYRSELTSELSTKFANLPSTPLSCGNSYTDLAQTLIAEKQKALEEKAARYTTFSGKISQLKKNAETADSNVAKSVNDTLNTFLKDHDNFSTDGWAMFYASVMVEWDDNPFLKGIVNFVDGLQKAKEGWDDLVTNLRYWYEVNGGKKIVDTVLAVAGLVLAVVGAVAAFAALTFTGPIWGIIVSVAGAVGAAIALINAGVNLYQQIKANGYADEDPAWAQYYGKINTASDALRKTTFKGWGADFFNRNSGTWANIIDVVETVCAVIKIADGVAKLYSRSGLDKLFGEKVKNVKGQPPQVKNGQHKYEFKWEKFGQTIFSSEGRGQIKNSLSKNWKYMLFGNPKQDGFWGSKFKQYSRATNKITITSLADFKSFKKFQSLKSISKLVNTDLGKVVNMGNSIEIGLKAIMYGGKGEDVYKIAKFNYDGFEKGGLVKSISSIYDTLKKWDKYKDNKSSYQRVLDNMTSIEKDVS